MNLSVVIPVYNEEAYLPKTLDALMIALAGISHAEIIVVDNHSTDSTRETAANFGAQILVESVRNIGKVRNTGASKASGEVIVFLDADTIVKPGVFEAIIEAMSDYRCFGGSVAVEYEVMTNRLPVRFFMKLWPILGRMTKMRQGALQFCRWDIFRELGGYDETIYVGEDIDFHWHLDKLVKGQDGFTAFITEPNVLTSSRRWQRMGLLRMIFFTHPVTIFFAWRFRSFWKDWYENAIR